MGKLIWFNLIPDDYDTYPREGITVIVSDNVNYDIAWYIMSSEYRWLKTDLVNDTVNDFEQFTITKWAYFN